MTIIGTRGITPVRALINEAASMVRDLQPPRVFLAQSRDIDAALLGEDHKCALGRVATTSPPRSTASLHRAMAVSAFPSAAGSGDPSVVRTRPSVE